jgi:hypothetical protein
MVTRARASLRTTRITIDSIPGVCVLYCYLARDGILEGKAAVDTSYAVSGLAKVHFTRPDL